MTGFNNNSSRPKGLKLFKLLALVGFMIDIITVGAIFIVLGHDAGGPTECTTGNGLCPHDTTSLGVWKNFPSAACCPDGNELMFNTSYRGILHIGNSVLGAPGEGGLYPILSVGCINPSNTVGASLQLQYANYSSTTGTNSSNFVNISGSVLIDNSANHPCPGNLETPNTGVAALPSINTNPVDFIFRVLGSGGGGSGDNPRFSSITVLVQQLAQKTFQTQGSGITTAHFLWRAFSTFAVATTTTITVNWIATNSTNGACGIVGGLLDSCLQSGTSTCSIAGGSSSCSLVTVTFATAFTGTVAVVISLSTPASQSLIPVSTLSLLQAQTLTV